MCPVSTRLLGEISVNKQNNNEKMIVHIYLV